MPLQPYDLEIVYRPGREMLPADGLSHLPITKDTHINLDLHIHIVPFSEERLSQVREETASDTILAKLKETVLEGPAKTTPPVPVLPC